MNAFDTRISTWRVAITTDPRSTSYVYSAQCTPAAAVRSAQITIDAFCWQGAEIVAVEEA